MDARSIVLLEFPDLRDRLVAATAFEPSRRLAAALEPSSDPVLVTQWLDQTDQARALASERPGVGIGGARDMGPAVERAARQGRLEPAQLLDVAVTLEATAHLVEALAEEPRPLLRGLVRRLSPLPHVRERLEQSVDPAGELLDTASPALGGLRREVRLAYERLRTRLEQLVHGEHGRAGPPGAHRDAAQRALRHARRGPTPQPRPRHRPRPVGQRPDAVRGAARGGGAGQRLARGPAGGPGGGGAHPR